MENLYVDGISNIYITGNLVRLDFAVLEPDKRTEQGEPVYQVPYRIVMPLESFTQAFNMQENIVGRLMEAGILQRTPAAAPAQPAQESETPQE